MIYDKLHQLYKKIVKHMLVWIEQLMKLQFKDSQEDVVSLIIVFKAGSIKRRGRLPKNPLITITIIKSGTANPK